MANLFMVRKLVVRFELITMLLYPGLQSVSLDCLHEWLQLGCES